jgi:GDPmannose 4,6-dehydratase
MFNHESPLRGGEFVTRKIAMAVAKIINGDQDVLMLGNLDACRDWSHARDIMQGAWMMLQQEEPDDYVLASGQAHTVRDFATEAFSIAGIHLDWQGTGLHETAVDAKSGRIIIRIDPALFRPLEVENLLGDPSKARMRLQWQCTTPFSEIVKELVESELKLLAPAHATRLRLYE